MKALGIMAGPRKGQVTDHLIDAALQGAKDRGAVTDKVYLYDLDIKPCTACNVCSTTKKCVIHDDHQAVLDKMNVADIVIFGSPTYESNTTSVAKKFMERSLSFFDMTISGPKRRSKTPSKVILITSCGAPFPFNIFMGMSTGCINAMKVFFKYMPVKIRTVTAAGVGDFDEKKCAKHLRKAYQLGKTI